MTRVLPYPYLSAGLLAIWLLLNQSLSPGHVLLGVLIAVIGGWSLSALDAPKAKLRRPLAALRLFGFVAVDIVRSNFAVAAIVLAFRRGQRTSGFVEIPLDLRDVYGLIALSFIITSTPGTVWVDFNAETGILKIHVLDLVDRAQWHATVKGRYERLLLEVFE